MPGTPRPALHRRVSQETELMEGSSENFMRRTFANVGFPLSDAEAVAFATYLRELTSWNARMNLTAVREEGAIVKTLFAESVCYALAHDFSTPSRVLDVGSGAGFPGIPLKIKFPEISLTLLESTGKKSAFLKHVIRAVGLQDTTCLAAHTNQLKGDPAFAAAFDVAVTRGTGTLRRLVPDVLPLLRAGGRFICRKGPGYEEDIRLAARQMDAARARFAGTIALPRQRVEHGAVLLVLERCST